MADIMSGMYEALDSVPSTIKFKKKVFRENVIIQLPGWHFASTIQCKEVSTQNKGLSGRVRGRGGTLLWFCQLPLL